MKKIFLILVCLCSFSSITLAQSKAPEDAKLYLISPTNGDKLTSPITVRFGLKNMGIAPAGTNVENTGHHHLLIDTGLPALDKPVPGDENHRHFGKGQTETIIELGPGKHTLQLLLGDFSHIPHNPPVISEQITITVY